MGEFGEDFGFGNVAEMFGGGDSGLGDMAGDAGGAGLPNMFTAGGGAPSVDAGGSAWLGDFAAGSPGGNLPSTFTTAPGREGGGGFWSGLQAAGKGFGDVAKGVLPFAQVGTAAMTGITGYQAAQQAAKQAKISEQGQQRQNEISAAAQAQAAPLSQFSTQKLQQAQGGQLDPAQEAQIQEWVRAAKIKARNYAAKSGQSSSSMLAQWEAWIDRQGLAFRSAALDAAERTAIAAAGQAGNLLGVGGQVAGQQAQNATAQEGGINQLIASANQALSRLSAGAS
jgi:hypothetical protein